MWKRTLALAAVICLLVCGTAFAYTDNSITGSWMSTDIAPLKDVILDGIEGMEDLGDLRSAMEVTGTVIVTFRPDGTCALDADVILSFRGIENPQRILLENTWQTDGSNLLLGDEYFIYMVSGDILILSSDRFTLRFTRTEDPAQEYSPCQLYGHSFVTEVTRNADCCREGEEVHTCTVCGCREICSIPRDPGCHGNYGTYTSGGWEATCESGGYSGDERCLGCGAVVGSGYYTSALGHEWIPATYSAPMTCARCGATSGSPLQSQFLIVTNWKGVNVRTAQSGSSTRLGHLDQGDVIPFSGELRYASDAWVQVSYNGQTAYVNTNSITMPFVAQFTEYYGSNRKITVARGSDLYILPDGNSGENNIVDTVMSDRQFNCIGTVKCVSSSLNYYVIRFDGKYYNDGREYSTKYVFVKEYDTKQN